MQQFEHIFIICWFFHFQKNSVWWLCTSCEQKFSKTFILYTIIGGHKTHMLLSKGALWKGVAKTFAKYTRKDLRWSPLQVKTCLVWDWTDGGVFRTQSNIYDRVFFQKKLKRTSNSLLHYLWSANLSKSFSVNIYLFSICFSIDFALWKSVGLTHIACIMIH